MNNYVLGGYIVSIGSLLSYGVVLATRERRATARVRVAVEREQWGQTAQAGQGEDATGTVGQERR